MDLQPCSFGTFPVKAEDLVLYFGKEKDNLGYVVPIIYAFQRPNLPIVHFEGV